jgi:hypothetical protein
MARGDGARGAGHGRHPSDRLRLAASPATSIWSDPVMLEAIAEAIDCGGGPASDLGAAVDAMRLERDGQAVATAPSVCAAPSTTAIPMPAP